MKQPATKPSLKKFYSSIVAIILFALCCWTPILVIVLGFLGIGLIIPYLDYVLLPSLAISVMLAAWYYLKYKQDCRKLN